MFTSVSIPEADLKTLNQIATTSGFINNFRGNHMYQNMGGRRFEDKTDLAGVRERGWGWGAFFFDFDNDGDVDALNGNGMDDPETTDGKFKNYDCALRPPCVKIWIANIAFLTLLKMTGP